MFNININIHTYTYTDTHTNTVIAKRWIPNTLKSQRKRGGLAQVSQNKRLEQTGLRNSLCLQGRLTFWRQTRPTKPLWSCLAKQSHRIHRYSCYVFNRITFQKQLQDKHARRARNHLSPLSKSPPFKGKHRFPQESRTTARSVIPRNIFLEQLYKTPSFATRAFRRGNRPARYG